MFSSSIHKSKMQWAVLATALLLTVPAAFASPGSNSSESGAYLGVTIGDLTTAQAAALNLHDNHGVVVQSLDHDGPACKAGIEPNDVITSVNGTRVYNVEQMKQVMQGLAAGSIAMIGIVRDGKAQSVKATLVSRKSWLEPKAAPMPNNYDTKSMTPLPPVPYSTDMDVPLMTPASARRGIVVEPLTAQLAEYFGVPGGQGVLVRNVQKGSLGATAGLRAGDVIVKIAGQPIRDLADWRRSMNISSGKTAFSIIREKREQVVEMVLPGPAGELRLGEDWDRPGIDVNAFRRQMQQLSPEIQRQTEQAMLRPDETEKMQREIEKSVRKGVNKELKHQAKEIRKSMKQLEPQVRQQTADIQKQMEQMQPEIDKQMAIAQEQMKQLGPEFQKQMEEMQKSITIFKQEDLAKMQAEIAAAMKNITPQIQEQMKQLGPQIQEQMKVLTPQIQQQMRELQKEMQQHQKEWQDMMKSWPNSSDRPNEM
jgi:membrane-associated protease RseP (regulator of RpoE activity)